MIRARTSCAAALLAALAAAVALTPVARAADPKEVRFTRVGSITCPSVRVYAGTTGEVRRILYKEGEAVKAGDVLTELHDPEVEADLKLVEAELALAVAAEKEFAASKSLGQLGASPAKEQLARFAAQVKVAEARVEVVKLRVAARTVRSPIAGTIGARGVDLGNLVRKGETELVTIYDLARVEVVVDVPELDVAGVRGKQRCTIRVDAFPELALVGEVNRMEATVRAAPAADLRFRESRTLRVYVTVQPPKGEPVRLLPGMSVQVGFGKPE